VGGALKRATRARVVLPTHCALNGVVERPLARYRTSASDSSLWLQWVVSARSIRRRQWLLTVCSSRKANSTFASSSAVIGKVASTG